MPFTKIVDLSIPLTSDTIVYPGDPEPDISQAASIEIDGYNVSKLIIGSHTGTHVDAPYHINPTGHRIDESPLEQFIGEGVLIDVTHKAPESGISFKDVETYLPLLHAGKIALFHTGWSQHLGTKHYYNHPYITKEVVEAFLKRGIRTFFIDALNIDPPDGSSFAAHDAITKANGIIGENFTNFAEIDFDKPLIIALPLKLTGLDGSPVRAIAAKTK
ncbi:cyclase family protein [Bacillus piscicola]|uniref:cyclase family protein n=1 Tax=Bacillus piscicola TaxID=1632684 RepID=UPI001F08B957|nr:cyclase family protein [Bacillus piscicola]